MKKISFPDKELEQLAKQDKIVTHRVSAEFGKYQLGDIVEAPWGQIYEVTGKRTIKSISQSPFAKFLTRDQLELLEQYDQIDVLRLEKSK